MRAFVKFVACAIGSAWLAGCSALETQYFREGIGTDLYRSDLPERTQLLGVYINYICLQAGLTADGQACNSLGLGTSAWTQFVQAGMNDIDQRCDAYLAWLDNRKRSQTPVLNQLAAMSAASAAILKAADAGPKSISLVGIAFGLAADTFTNIQSRLLFDIDHSTVQTVVLGHQQEFRASILKTVVDNEPAAIYLLRGYLRICMPFSIEMSINNTISVYHRAGAGALTNMPLLNRVPATAQTHALGALVRSIPPEGARGPLPGVGRNPPVPKGGEKTAELPISGAKNNGVEDRMPQGQLGIIQENLCVAATLRFDSDTRTAIQQAKIGARQSGQAVAAEPPFNNIASEIKSRSEVQTFLDARSCRKDSSGADRAYITAFEKFRFANRAAINDLQRLLNTCDRSLSVKDSESFDRPTRAAILAVKTKAPNAEKAKFADLNSGTLDDKSYEYINKTCIP
jgi:hypothetical protein